MAETRHVKLGPKLFAKEKSMYRDWITSLARENIQNSVDAGAPNIDIKIEDDGNLLKVTFTDNGPGMDIETLENIYFVLGETTKTNGNTVGGFGVARMLTCFAQDHYTLRTRDISVIGCGAEWTPTTGLPYFRGVELVAWVDPQGVNLKEKFENYLRRCHITATVTLNGTRWTEWTYRNKFERKLSFCRIFTNKSKQSGVFVRVNGVQMFSPFCNAPFNVVVEIDQERSRQVLQANRDGLLSEFQQELESFVAELNINKQSALREKRSKSTTFKGTGTFTSKRTAKKAAEKEVEEFETLLAANNVQLPEKMKKAMLQTTPEYRSRAMVEILQRAGIETPEVVSIGRKHDSGFEIEEQTEQLRYELFNVVLHDDTTNPKVRKVIDSYNPMNWDLLGLVGMRFDKRYGDFKSFRAGVEKYKLLVIWKAACEFCIDLMQNTLHRGPEEIGWGVGWIFSDIAEAERNSDSLAYHEVGVAGIYKPTNVNWLLLNPCDVNGTMRLSIAAKRDLIEILSLAAHEVCHIVYDDHDEHFANLLNDLLEECMANLSEAINAMKGAKDEAMARLEGIKSSA